MSTANLIDKDKVEYIAELAHLDLSESEIDSAVEYMALVLNYVGKLEELDTDIVEPTYHPVTLSSVCRSDKVERGIDPELVLRAAPEQIEQSYGVPRILD